jgi:hypothetical protein
MTCRIACLIALVLVSRAGLGAEFFYMDRDQFSDKFVGPEGPLVISGEIVPGDYELLVSKIAADQDRFLQQNKLLLASESGDTAEAIKIARLVRSLFTNVVVGPLTGRCSGACFLIYSAATQRGSDGARLVGVSLPGVDESRLASLPTAQAAVLRDQAQEQARAFLQENKVPPFLAEEMFKHEGAQVYWLSEQDERSLGSRSVAFDQYLVARCGWDDSIEHEVFAGKRPMGDLKQMWACRARVTQPDARKALSAALKARGPVQIKAAIAH